MVKYGTVNVTIKGLTPLLMNKMNIADLKTHDSRSVASEYKPEDEAKKAAYIAEIDGKQQLFIPGYAVYSMIIKAAGAYKFPKRRSSLSTYLAGTIRVEPEKIPLGTDQYEIDERPVVIQRARVLKWRPKINDWIATFQIVYNKDALPDAIIPQLEAIIEDGGTRLGLLDYRPQHKGWFGTFTVTDFKID